MKLKVRTLVLVKVPLVLISFFLLETFRLCAQQAQHDSLSAGNRTAAGVEQSNERRQNDSNAALRQEVNYWRLAAVSGTAVGTLGASYLYLKDTWWKDTSPSFHFDQGGDLKYALNLDKAAHFYGGTIAADLFYSGLRWSNMEPRPAAWLGAGMGIFVQGAIELKDAYADNWGFSVYDLLAGTAGSLFFVGKHYSSFLRTVDLKFSYWYRSDRYYQLKETGRWNDDYVNQTYWLSFKVNEYLPETLEQYWPDWLALAMGVSLDDQIVGYDARYPDRTGGNRELYIALDVDITKILPSDNPFWEGLKHYLNYIKFPAPAIRVSPGVIIYGLYF